MAESKCDNPDCVRRNDDMRELVELLVEYVAQVKDLEAQLEDFRSIASDHLEFIKLLDLPSIEPDSDGAVSVRIPGELLTALIQRKLKLLTVRPVETLADNID